jgi:hypothetical protein
VVGGARGQWAVVFDGVTQDEVGHGEQVAAQSYRETLGCAGGRVEDRGERYFFVPLQAFARNVLVRAAA